MMSFSRTLIYFVGFVGFYLYSLNLYSFFSSFLSLLTTVCRYELFLALMNFFLYCSSHFTMFCVFLLFYLQDGYYNDLHPCRNLISTCAYMYCVNSAFHLAFFPVVSFFLSPQINQEYCLWQKSFFPHSSEWVCQPHVSLFALSFAFLCFFSFQSGFCTVKLVTSQETDQYLHKKCISIFCASLVSFCIFLFLWFLPSIRVVRCRIHPSFDFL